MKSVLKATIFIPTYNGEFDHLRECLEGVFMQQATFKYEVLVWDSESKDNTQKIIQEFAAKHKNLRWKVIKKNNFSHGGTRQDAAKEAKGEYVVYLSQDAVPANDSWLSEMISPFSISDKIVAVLGRQEPRRSCFPAMKYDIRGTFNNQGISHAITLWQRYNKNNIGNYTEETFYSDVCSAAPRKFLTEKIGYRKVAYAEDYQFGLDIIDAGYTKAYNGRAVVEHSNDVGLKEYKNRLFDEVYSTRKNSGITNKFTMKNVLVGTIKQSFRNTLQIFQDSDYSKKRKMYWLMINPLYVLERNRGIRLGNKVDLDIDLKKYSLEKMREEKRSK